MTQAKTPAKSSRANGANVLSASDIINRDDRPVHSIPVDAWGGSVLCRPLTLDEQAEYSRLTETDLAEGEDDATRGVTIIVQYLVRALVNEDKRPLFTEDDLADLAKKNGDVLQTLFEDCVRTNKTSAASIDDAEKN